MQPTKPAPTSAPCTDARLRHRHPRPNCLSRISGHPTASTSALETRSPFTAGRTGGRSGAAACLNVRGSVPCLNVQGSVPCLNVQSSVACLNARGSDRFCDRSPARPVLLSKIFYVLVARSADRRAEWIKRDCTPAESRHRTVCYKPDGVGRLRQRQQPRHFPQSALSSAWRPSPFPPFSLVAPSLAFVCGIAVVAMTAAAPSGPTALSVW